MNEIPFFSQNTNDSFRVIFFIFTALEVISKNEKYSLSLDYNFIRSKIHL